MTPDRVWRNFIYDEFRCGRKFVNEKVTYCSYCGGENETSHKLISLLDYVRSIIAMPMVVNSGFRCKKHNKKIDGNPESEHLTGEGADIKCESSKMRYLLIKTALSIGFLRIGIGNGFIHFGISPDRPNEVVWLYP